MRALLISASGRSARCHHRSFVIFTVVYIFQSDYGVSFLSQATPTYSRRQVSIEPVQMRYVSTGTYEAHMLMVLLWTSLQLGLANYLGLPVHKVYEVFETVRRVDVTGAVAVCVDTVPIVIHTETLQL